MSNATTKASKSPAKQKLSLAEANAANAKVSSPKTKIRWNALVGVVLAVVIFFAAQLISGVLLSYYRYPRHWTNGQLLNWLNNSINAQFLFILIAESLIV